MLDILLSPYLVLFARLCVAGVFLASGFGKLADRPGTEASMSRYPFLPAGAGKFIAAVFPYLELAVGLLMLLGLFTRPASIAALLLFVMFTGFILYDLANFRNQSCHCFGRFSDDKVTPMSVVRNVFLVLLAALVFVGFDGWLSIDSNLQGAQAALVARQPSGPLPGMVDALPVVLLAVAAVLVIVVGGQAVSMVRTTLRGLGYRS